MFRATSGWKQAVVRDVCMLPRSGMYKPDVARLCEAEIVWLILTYLLTLSLFEGNKITLSLFVISSL